MAIFGENIHRPDPPFESARPSPGMSLRTELGNRSEKNGRHPSRYSLRAFTGVNAQPLPMRLKFAVEAAIRSVLRVDAREYGGAFRPPPTMSPSRAWHGCCSNSHARGGIGRKNDICLPFKIPVLLPGKGARFKIYYPFPSKVPTATTAVRQTAGQPGTDACRPARAIPHAALFRVRARAGRFILTPENRPNGNNISVQSASARLQRIGALLAAKASQAYLHAIILPQQRGP